MNLQIRHLSEVQSFVKQKCLIPMICFPTGLVPGTLAKCLSNAESWSICRIFPIENSDDCFLDESVQLVQTLNTPAPVKRLIKVEPIQGKVRVANTVNLIVRLTDVMFERNSKKLTLDYLISILWHLLQPLSLVSGCTVVTEELVLLGIASVKVELGDEDDSLAFSIGTDTALTVNDVQMHNIHPASPVLRLHGLEQPRQELQDLLENAELYHQIDWKMKHSFNALVAGPVGSGKTTLCESFIAANNCNSYSIRASSILGQYPGETEAALRKVFTSARRFVSCFHPKLPTVIIIEDLHLVCTSNKSSSGDSGNPARISNQLIALLDDLHESKEHSSRIIVIATTSEIEAIDAAIRRPGRFGREINIPPLCENSRAKLFQSLHAECFFAQDPSFRLTEEMLTQVAKHTSGFVAADMALLIRGIGQTILRDGSQTFQQILANILKTAKPVSIRCTDVSVYKSDQKFDSIGGMEGLKRTLEVSVLAGLTHRKAFERFGLSLPKGLLLYGPPGCAKTTIAKCLATEANMTFIATSAAEVYSPYVGCAEKFIVKIFDTARKNSPCLVFLDEIDALVGKRSNDSKSDVQTRILSTLLTEMDGIISINNVPFDNHNQIVVVGATNRPDMVDDALMRPGRFDKLIHVPSPDISSRQAILSLHAKRMPFAVDVNLERIAAETANFSGADLCNLCNEAAMNAFNRDFNAISIGDRDFIEVLTAQKSSLTQAQIQWYYDFEKKYMR